MKKAKNRTAGTVTTMLVVALAILSFYFYWSYRTAPINETSNSMTEAQKLIEKDFVNNYPQTPREVVKVFGSILKALYDDVQDEDAEPLALKIRELYDKEFLSDNPEEAYLQNLYSDIAAWKKKGRRITSYILVDDELEQQEEIDEVQYATVFISFTIQENRKFAETWKVILRQNENNRWKILGWQTLPAK